MVAVFSCSFVKMVRRHRGTIFSSVVVVITAWLLFLSGYWNILFTNADTRPMTVFSNGSQFINDIQNGSFEHLIDGINNREITTFVLFYAPWSGDCIRAADEFATVSKVMTERYGSQVQFFAINCWIGSCKINLNTDVFPVLAAYHGTQTPVTYTGNLEAWRMLLFLDNIMRPFFYVGSHYQWDTLIQTKEDYLIGYFNRQSKGFHLYLSLCLTIATRANMPKCCIITNKNMKDAVNMKSLDDIILYQPLYNESSLFDTQNKNSNITSLLQWVQDNRVQVISEFVPNSTHMANYRNQLMNGPVLILFLSKAPEYKSWTTHALSKFRDMAAKYRNCSCYPVTSKRYIPLSSKYELNETVPPKVKTLEDCSLKHHPNSPLCKTLSMAPNIKQDLLCDACQSADFETTPCQDFLVSQQFYELRSKLTLKSEHCVTLAYSSYYFNPNISICCSKASVKLAQGFLMDIMRRFSALNDVIAKASETQIEEEDSADNNDGKESIADTEVCEQVDANNAIDFGYNGLGCHCNKTVTFHFMDVDRYNVIVNQLGVKPNPKTSTALAIVDIKNEAQYILDEALDINNDNIQSFVLNFTTGTLARHLRSSSAENSCGMNDVCILEVTSNTFHQTVLKADRDVLLLYFSPFCGACTALRSSYLKVAETVKNISSLVVARINGDENDLPWSHTVSQYPTIVLYPAYSKHQSVMFSRDLPLSPANILEFSRRNSAYRTRKLLNKLMNADTNQIE